MRPLQITTIYLKQSLATANNLKESFMSCLIPYFSTETSYIDYNGERVDYDTGWLATYKCFNWLGCSFYKLVNIKDEDLY